MRRKIDEKDYQPHVGILYSDATFKRIPLDCKADIFIKEGQMPKGAQASDNRGMERLLKTIGNLADASIDFTDAVKLAFPKGDAKREMRELILKALEYKE